MPDPFTALGAASSIVALLEFAWKLLANTKKICTTATGETDDHAALSDIAADVSRLGDAITTSPRCEQDLLNLVKESKRVALDLLEALAELKVQGENSVWKSFAVALRTVWKKGKIEAFSCRLAKLQGQVASHVQLMILNGVSDVSQTLTELEHTNRLSGTKVQSELRFLRAEVIALSKRLGSDESSIRDSLKMQLKLGKNITTLDEELVNDKSVHLLEFSDRMSDLHQAGIKAADMYHVLTSFYFSQISTRQRKIPEAHEKTFSWVFRRSSPDERMRIKFVDWLQDQSGIFWVYGKPGSGKSTLMKFLSQHQETQLLLRSWAGNCKLIFAQFFFWHAGSYLQKSREGLLRALLFEIVQKHPNLVPRVYELRGQLRDKFDNDWSWTPDELRYLCQHIFEESSDIKFCFFIDGLDEYDEGRIAATDIIDTIKILASLPTIKFCVSSRPWSVFFDAFGQDPDLSLKLEDLTRSDIEQYVSDKFSENAQFQKMKMLDATCSNLINEICQRARGVFLWVYLVVRDLLDGFSNGDPIHLLRARLERFPEDLDQFFRHMIDTISPVYFQHTARFFDIAKSTAEPQLAIAFSFIDQAEDGLHFAANMSFAPMLETEINYRQDQVRRRLDARCKGLLEVTSDDGDLHEYFELKVDFLHRTVRDFLARSDGLGQFVQEHIGSVDTALVMCGALTATLNQIPSTRFVDYEKINQLTENLFNWAAQAEQTGKGSKELVNLLLSADTAYSTYYKQNSNENKGHEFLGLACRRGISSYVEARLADEEICTKINGPERPLLDYTIYYNDDAQLRVVKHLLDKGADPNRKFGHLSVWGRYMSWINDNPQCGDHQRIWDVINTLVEKGADLDVLIPSAEAPTWGRLSHRDCLYGETAWLTYGRQATHREDMITASQAIISYFGGKEASALLNKYKRRTRGLFTPWSTKSRRLT